MSYNMYFMQLTVIGACCCIREVWFYTVNQHLFLIVHSCQVDKLCYSSTAWLVISAGKILRDALDSWDL